jgi:outer membrane lipoprotein LolB
VKPLQHLTLLFCLLILAACSSHQPQPDNTNWRQQREKLKTVTHWTISGKLAIITADKKGSARIQWQQDGDDYHLNLTSLLGTRVMEMRKTGNQVLIIDDKGREYRGSDAEYLVYRLTGWQMPIHELPIWIKGLPDDTDYELNPNGQVTRLKTTNWQLQYQSYQPVDGWMMPEKITFKGKQTELRLVISEWDLTK